MARGEEGLQVLRDHVVEHRAAGIPRCIGGHRWRHTSPHGQQGENGSTRRCHLIYCSNVQYTSKMFPEDTEETRGTHHRATVPSLCVVHTVVTKVRLKFLSMEGPHMSLGDAKQRSKLLEIRQEVRTF